MRLKADRRAFFVSRTRYRIVYRVVDETDTVEVLTIVHTSERPSKLYL